MQAHAGCHIHSHEVMCMGKRNERGIEILPNDPLDMSAFHPSVRETLGDGMPIATMRAPNGVKVIIMGSGLPKTKEENARRIQHAFDVANRIAYNEGRRRWEQMKQEAAMAPAT